MENNPLEKLNRLLAVEEDFTLRLSKTLAARNLRNSRSDLLEHVREVARSNDLSLIIGTGRAIVEGDLTRYANSESMTSSLKTALDEIAVIERHTGIVDDPDEYRAVDQAHSLPRNRKGGLPLDEAHQALASHHARLLNMDKSRLGDDEKKVVDVRRPAIYTAGKLYAERQARTLGVNLAGDDAAPSRATRRKAPRRGQELER